MFERDQGIFRSLIQLTRSRLWFCRTKMASFQKKAVKPPPSEGGGGDQAQEKSEDETPVLTAKAPEPAIVSALQELYKSSFSVSFDN
jgi:hypothetical protein